MNIFEEHGLMLLTAEQGRQQFNRDAAVLMRGWFVRAAAALRRTRRRVFGTPVRY